jgi:hypothetical protein
VVPSLPFFAFVVGGAFALPLAGGGTALPLAGGGGAAFPLPGLILPLASAVLLSFALLTAAAVGPKQLIGALGTHEAEIAVANGVATKTDAAAAACRHTQRPHG